MTRRVAPWCAVLCAMLMLAACDRSERDMLRQPRYIPDAPSPLFPDGKATRPPPPGAVPRSSGDAAAISSGRGGTQALELEAAAQAQQALAQRPSPALLRRGQARYTIYCVPCHSAVGDGDGPVVRRGFPAPPSFHADRLRGVDDRHIFDVISHGYGVMYPLGDRVPPSDRWAIVAYVRALQLSRHARVADLPDGLKAQVGAAAAAAVPGEWRAVPAPPPPSAAGGPP